MPTFCRHNRFVENCPICRTPEPEPAARPRAPRRGSGGGRSAGATGARSLRVSRVEQAADDGFRTGLAPGLRAGADAERLAAELAFSAGRLAQLATDPPGPFADVGSLPDAEAAIALAFLIAYVSPGEGDAEWAGVAAAARTPWHEWPPSLDDVPTGPRSPHDPARGTATLAAYRAWAARAGSQLAALEGEPSWPAERRFARAFERLALPGLPRATRLDFLMALGRTGRLEARSDSLFVTAGDDDAVVGAKRVFGIGDPMLIDRRARDLAEACALPFDALDLALYNWQRGGERVTLGAGSEALDEEVRERIAAELGV